jgi:monothiol glutaredoxin
MTHPAAQHIQETIDNNSVVLFMKGSKEMPQCGFSNAVVNALSYLKVEFKDVDVLQNEEIRDGIKVFSEWPTIPQLYVKGEFIGGCDIVKEMFDTGELSQLFDEKEIPHSKKD